MEENLKLLYLCMETLVINIPEDKSVLIKQLLIELGAEIQGENKVKNSTRTPNSITLRTIKDAREGKDLGEPIQDIKSFLSSL